MRSIAVYFLTLSAAILYWIPLSPAVFLSFCFPAAARRRFLRKLLLGFGLLTVRAAWRPFFEVRFTDLSGGAREPGVIVVNHRSASDPFLVAVARRCAAQTVNRWPLRLPIIGWMARAAGYLDITGWELDKISERVREIIAGGDMIISYPEGTRSEGKTMNVFHSGIFRIAREFGLPLYMLCIAGNEYMPDRRFRFREFRDLEVRLLPPLSPGEVAACASDYALKMKVFRIMEKELAAMDAALGSAGERRDECPLCAGAPETRISDR